MLQGNTEVVPGESAIELYIMVGSSKEKSGRHGDNLQYSKNM